MDDVVTSDVIVDDGKASFASMSVSAAVVSTAPEPISLDEAKAHLRVHLPDDDAYISALIVAARMMLEGRINRALVPQEVEFTLPRFGIDGITLPRLPYLNGLEVFYVDSNGESAQFFDYEIDTFAEPAVMYPASGQVFPMVTYGRGAVRIKYLAGYSDPASVPAPLKWWMRLAIGTMYQHRETTVVGVSVTPLPEDFMRMLWQPYMVYV